MWDTHEGGGGQGVLGGGQGHQGLHEEDNGPAEGLEKVLGGDTMGTRERTMGTPGDVKVDVEEALWGDTMGGKPDTKMDTKGRPWRDTRRC